MSWWKASLYTFGTMSVIMAIYMVLHPGDPDGKNADRTMGAIAIAALYRTFKQAKLP